MSLHARLTPVRAPSLVRRWKSIGSLARASSNYDEAMAVELALRGIGFERQRSVSVLYKGQEVGEGRLDFLVDDSLVVELKAAERLLPIHQAQLLSYMKATRCRLGLLINFHERLLRDGIKRIVFTTTDD